MNTANIARSLVGGIIKSQDMGLKNHALGLFYAELKKSGADADPVDVKADKVTMKALQPKLKLLAVEPAPVVLPNVESPVEGGEVSENKEQTVQNVQNEAASKSTTEAEATAPATEPAWRSLELNEVIQQGDEWILRESYRPNRGGVRMWRVVGDAVGKTPAVYAKSNFRRRIA